MTATKRALISVSDKTGVVDFARGLSALGIEILSTGGTAKLLAANDIAATEVADYTGFPEIMDGRVKTLHPKIHGGLLARRGVDDEVMAANGIQAIDMVVVNLYPFEKTVSDPRCNLPTAIENIDIGGPTMLRAAAKNHHFVSVLVDPIDYAVVLEELQTNHCSVSDATRYRLASKAFDHTARYDGIIANYLGRIHPESNERELFPNSLNLQFVKKQTMRYGENPHQQAAFYVEPNAGEASVATANQIQGKELSYNNIADADAALECVKQFEEPACVIVKHANPCGVCQADDLTVAYDRAYACDPTSAFGGIIAFNRELDAHTARTIVERQFVEVIIAPGISADAKPILADKKNVRVLTCNNWSARQQMAFDFKRVNGGLLVQDRDLAMVDTSDLQVVTRRQPSEREILDLLFAWKVCKYIKSNAIVYCRDHMTVGVGAGQMSRVYSARIAAIKAADAGLDVKGSVLASDAFFPFRDGLDSAAEVGVTAVIQPGGSLRDDEVIAAADEHGIAMVFTGIRHFRH